MPLSEPQVRHFFAFGFVKVPALFDAGEVAVLTAALESAIRREHCLPDPPTVRATVHNWWEGEPAAAFVQPHPKVLELCGQLLGDGFVGSHNGRSNDDGNLYVGDTAWHADMGWDPKIPLGRSDPLRADAAAQLVSDNAHLHMFPSIKIAFYLDPTTKETGALRMVPGSHKSPMHERCWSLHMGIADAMHTPGRERQNAVLTDMASEASSPNVLQEPSANIFGVPDLEVPCVAVETLPGDAVVFSHQLYHASFGGGVRRMFTLNFRARLPQSKEEQLAFTWEDVQARLLKAPSQSARL